MKTASIHIHHPDPVSSRENAKEEDQEPFGKITSGNGPVLTTQLQWKEHRIDRDGRLLCPPGH